MRVQKKRRKILPASDATDTGDAAVGLRDAPDQFRVEATASALCAAAPELGGGAEPRACVLADGLGLGEGLVTCARPARIRLSPHRAARPLGSPGWRGLDVGAAPHLWPRVWGAVSMHIACI